MEPLKRPESKRQCPDDSKIVFKGNLFEVRQWEQQLFDGSKTIFEMLIRPDTVRILPVLNDDLIIFVEETQPSIPTKLRTPGGRIEQNETPEQAANRELMEEIGYVASELRLWDAWQPDDKIDSAVYLYVAHGLKQTSTVITPEAGERFRPLFIPIKALLDKNLKLTIDDNYFLYKLYFTFYNEQERRRLLKLLTP